MKTGALARLRGVTSCDVAVPGRAAAATRRGTPPAASGQQVGQRYVALRLGVGRRSARSVPWSKGMSARRWLAPESALLCSALLPARPSCAPLLCSAGVLQKGKGEVLCSAWCSALEVLCSATLLRSGWFCLISKPAARHLVAGAIILLLWCCTRRLRTEKVPCCCLWRLQVIFSAIEVPSSLLQ